MKAFTGVLTSIPDLIPSVKSRLEVILGPIDLCSELFPFDSTDYYNVEMGTPICRYFFGFHGLIDPGSLSALKISTNELEKAFASACRDVARPVNIDPGYLELSKIVLASTKNFYHRILIADGIFAEVTLHYEKGAWRPFPWSFPDFRSGRYDAFFAELRSAYRVQLKGRE